MSRAVLSPTLPYCVSVTLRFLSAGPRVRTGWYLFVSLRLRDRRVAHTSASPVDTLCPWCVVYPTRGGFDPKT